MGGYRIETRNGPQFNDRVTLDEGVTGVVRGNVGKGKAELIVGGVVVEKGSLELRATTTDGGRATRSWVYRSGGRTLLVSEQGLSAGRD